MRILGISCFYHDSAACLVRDGEIISAAQEERFTRKKNDPAFPANAVAYCLSEEGISVNDLDIVVFYDKPFVKFERILETFLAYAPRGISQFSRAVPPWIREKLWVTETIRDRLGFRGKVLFTRHHEAHAASAFYPSPFNEAAFLTIDGVGEWDTASFGTGKGNNLSIRQRLKFPNSLGLLYSAFTYYTGFKVNSGEYKLMGLAPYGEPVYKDIILKELIDLKEDGSFRLNMEYFGFCNGLRMTNRRFERLFGGPPRKPDEEITARHMDVASSIQGVTEEIMLKMAAHVRRATGQDRLCLAGGVALNCVGNSRILRSGLFKEVWIQPAGGDAGGALGAALLAWYRYLGNKRIVSDGETDAQKVSLLGPHYADDYIESFLKKENIPYLKLGYGDIIEKVSDLIISGKVIGWFQGRMEFGPRALGARSILADARNAQMCSRINREIKYRESFRPFASAVLKEEACKWFDFEGESPYMLLTAQVSSGRRMEASGDYQGLARLEAVRSSIPSVTHVDYSSRVQTVERDKNPLFYDLIRAFYRKTGCPVIINTSFNVRGEPLAMSPQDAYRCFMRTHLDYLALGPFLLDKKMQPAGQGDIEAGIGEDRMFDSGSDKIKLRKFGFSGALSFLLLSGFFLLRKEHASAAFTFTVSCLFSLAGLIFPLLLKPLHAVSVSCFFALGKAATNIALFFLFYLVFTPLGMFMRLCGIDLLERRGMPDSYWKETEGGPDIKRDYERRF